MRALLLDTHALVWLLAGDSRLGAVARERIDQAAEGDGVLVCAITPWEIAMLVAKGRLALGRDVGEWVQAALSLPGVRLAPLSPEVAVASARLPGVIHGDPADRLIAATARHHGATLVTDDRLLLEYAAQGHLSALAARV